MNLTDVPTFEHEGFEIQRPWRDCGADWNIVDPQLYGFKVGPRNDEMRLTVPGQLGYFRLHPVEPMPGVDGGMMTTLRTTYSRHAQDGLLVWEATVAQVDDLVEEQR